VGERNTNILMCENLQSPISAFGELLLQHLFRQEAARRGKKKRGGEKRMCCSSSVSKENRPGNQQGGGREERGKKRKKNTCYFCVKVYNGASAFRELLLQL